MANQQGNDGHLRELALFAGAGGGILAGKMLGWRTICAVEWEAYPASVLAARQNDGHLEPFPIWDDVRTFDGSRWQGRVDVVSGGFPCQKFSSAARGRNTAPDLWPEMLRVIRAVKPPVVFAENVAKRAIQKAADDLRSIGYKAAGVPLSARDLGADHLRQRYWLIAHADNEGELFCRQYAEMELLPSLYESVWASEPDGRRVANGVASRVDRLKATGNGQVPQCAAAAFIEGCRRLQA